MGAGLSVSDVISVTVNLSPPGAQFANLDTAVIIGDSPIIDTGSRLRTYATLAEVAADFGTSAPEYAGAALFFAQNPTPQQLYIGRWAAEPTNGLLIGGTLSAPAQIIGDWTSITAGAFKIQVDAAASPVEVGPINFSGATTFPGIAALVSTALTTASVGATCTYDALRTRFIFTSATTGAASKVKALTTPSSGTDISSYIGGSVAGGGDEVDGLAGESALAAVEAIDALPTSVYGMTFATTSALANSDHEAIAAYIQANSKPHIYGISTADPAATNPGLSTDIGSILMGLGYTRTFLQYSSLTSWAACSIFGRTVTVNFQGSNTTITLAFQTEPGIVAETLTETQAAALNAKRYNYFANFNNGTAILMNGWCAGPAYIDEIFGLDWLANEVQVDLFNFLATVGTKVPQTDAGNNALACEAEGALEQGVDNGLIAPGYWNSGGFGALNPGDFMPKGWYVYPNPMATQAAAVRATRAAPPLQIAVKLAGAIQSADALINVNR